MHGKYQGVRRPKAAGPGESVAGNWAAPEFGRNGQNADEPDQGEGAGAADPRQVVPILGGSRHFYKLLEGLIEKHGSRPISVDSVFDLIELVQRFRPRAVFVSLELLLAWNRSGMERLALSEPFRNAQIVAFTERWQREELPQVPGLDRAATLCVPLSITHLESIIERYSG
jgi:hypothetical protein